MHRPAVAALVAVALVVAGGSAWAWETQRDGATGTVGQERVASAVTAGADDERAASSLAGQSAGLAGQRLLESSHDELAAAISSAQAVLDGSAGQVADDSVRQRLAAAISSARAAAAGTVAPERADELAVGISSSAAAVTVAQRAWQADQAAQAKAAAEAAVAAAARASAQAEASAAARASADPSPPATGSCTTTYTGPPFYTSVPTASGDGSNGNIPASAMAPVSWAVDPHGNGYWLVKAATASLERLNVAFRAAFGHDLDIDLAYRDLATQKAMYAALGPAIAATPGHSNHGTGTAIDVPEWPCEYGLHTPERDWLVAHGPAYGWHPIAAEYWHFNYEP